ncbi:MAG: hypothetical protein WKG01_30440 [Kofleriaceae bacterium]
MKAASALPTVESSLEEFIAKANQTLVDVGGWGAADQAAKAAEEKRREQDALRWKQAEQQMRESEARELALRQKLDGLQGTLAVAEARAAIAGTTQTAAADDPTLGDLKHQIDQAMERMRAAEDRSQQMQRELAQAKLAAGSSVALELDAGDSDERVRVAEAKATKAIAAARAAQAGLTVSSADLAAIESGLISPVMPQKKTPWMAIAVAFVGGLGIMALVWKFGLAKDDATVPVVAVAQPAQSEVAPAPADTPLPAAKPSATPIDDQAAAPAAPRQDERDEGKPKVTPIVDPEAAVVAVKTEPAPVTEEPTAEQPKAEPRSKRVKKARVTSAKKPATAATKTKFADPFADDTAAKPEKAPKAEKTEKTEKTEKIVDPF